MKNDYQLKIITKLKQLREKNGFSQAEIAKILDISPGQLGNIESYNRSHKYTIAQILTLCDIYNYPIEQLMSIDNKQCSKITPRDIVSLIVKYQNNK